MQRSTKQGISALPMITRWVVTTSYLDTCLRYWQGKALHPQEHGAVDFRFGSSPSEGPCHLSAIRPRSGGKNPMKALLSVFTPQKRRRWAARPVLPLSPYTSKLYPAIILPMIPSIRRSAHRRRFWNGTAISLVKLGDGNDRGEEKSVRSAARQGEHPVENLQDSDIRLADSRLRGALAGGDGDFSLSSLGWALIAEFYTRARHSFRSLSDVEGRRKGDL